MTHPKVLIKKNVVVKRTIMLNESLIKKMEQTRMPVPQQKESLK
jgi:hypothetical protein